jgi:hypothetical protein
MSANYEQAPFLLFSRLKVMERTSQTRRKSSAALSLFLRALESADVIELVKGAVAQHGAPE